MVTTSYRDLWSAMWSYKDHGKSWEEVYERQHPPGFRWLHESFGTNWRMTEMQAGIGRIQLGRMADWTNKRGANAKMITDALELFAEEGGPIRLPEFSFANLSDTTHNKGCVNAHYKFYAYVGPQNLAPDWSRDRIVEDITARGVSSFQGSWSEVYLEHAFDGTGWRPEPGLSVAKELGETSLMFLVHPTLTYMWASYSRGLLDFAFLAGRTLASGISGLCSIAPREVMDVRPPASTLPTMA